MASGGVATRPTLALIGEKGREYVLNDRQMKKMRGGGGVSIGDVIVNGRDGMDPDTIGRIAGQAVASRLKNSGHYRSNAKRQIRGGL